MFKKITLFIFAALTLTDVQAKVKLPHIICDNMILQQKAETRLWGWDKPGKNVLVYVSWSKSKYKVTADLNGRWLVKVKTPAASYTPLSITFNDGESTTIHNIYSGEVWVCGGQSNMEFPVKGFNNCPNKDYNETIVNASTVHGIYYVKIPSVMSMTPLDDADCKWEQIDINTVSDCSAVGYAFAQVIHKALHIPVGLILANKGGTRVESWLDKDNLKKYTQEPLDSIDMARKFSWDYLRPLLWGNGTFHPILNYTVKGILFYQGCSNVGDPGNQYSERMKLLAEQWRRDFKEGDIPFYFVQIAPYTEGDGNDGISGALLREQQLRAMDIISNSDLVCTNDLVYPYEYSQIHPCQKEPVGERLAFIALSHNYGIKNIISDSPRYKNMTISNDSCYIRLQNNEGGYSRYEDIEGFEVAGADKIFHKAKASHYWVPGNDQKNETIVVTSSEVQHPVAVRYCFRNFQLGNLKNGGMLPLFPFRTDKW